MFNKKLHENLYPVVCRNRIQYLYYCSIVVWHDHTDGEALWGYRRSLLSLVGDKLLYSTETLLKLTLLFVGIESNSCITVP